MKGLLVGMACVLVGSVAVAAAHPAALLEGPKATLELPPGLANPRNSEGDMIRLKDGRVLLVYSRYTKGTGGDNDPAVLASRVSSDGGLTWSRTDEVVVAQEGAMNVMSVSCLRMRDGAIGLFYLVKNSEADCRPVLRRSTDEGRTWSAPVKCIPDSEVGYYVLNNCRAVRLASGRIVLPMSFHEAKNGRTSDWAGKLVCYLSDDDGKTWFRNAAPFATYDATGRRVTTQEPGVVELKDGRVLMYARTAHGRQWFFYSSDGCRTWTKGEPGSLFGPCAPATVKRLASGELVAVWNDHESFPAYAKQGPKWSAGTRKPFSIALSTDEGRTWIDRKVVEDLPQGWYCYFAVLEMDGYLLVEHCAEKMLQHSRVTVVPLAWLRK